MERILTPQQELFLELYSDPTKTATFANARQAALAAGYSESYADNLTNLLPEWLSDFIGDARRIAKAEQNLNEYQSLSVLDKEGVPNPAMVSAKGKIDMFILERTHKKKYAARNEMTGADGIPLPAQIVITQHGEPRDSSSQETIPSTPV